MFHLPVIESRGSFGASRESSKESKDLVGQEKPQKLQIENLWPNQNTFSILNRLVISWVSAGIHYSLMTVCRRLTEAGLKHIERQYGCL